MAAVTSSMHPGGGSRSYFGSGVWWGSFLSAASGDGVFGRGSPLQTGPLALHHFGTEAPVSRGHPPPSPQPLLGASWSYTDRYPALACRQQGALHHPLVPSVPVQVPSEGQAHVTRLHLLLVRPRCPVGAAGGAHVESPLDLSGWTGEQTAALCSGRGWCQALSWLQEREEAGG